MAVRDGKRRLTLYARCVLAVWALSGVACTANRQDVPNKPVYFFDGSLPERQGKPKRAMKTRLTTNQKKVDWFWWWPWKKADQQTTPTAHRYKITAYQPKQFRSSQRPRK